MSHRRRILKRLKHFYDAEGPGALLLLDPIDIIGKPGNQRYAAAVNQLVSEGMIRGIAMEGSNRPAFCLNPKRIDDVMKALRWYRDPAAQFIVGALLAVAGLVLTFFLGQ